MVEKIIEEKTENFVAKLIDINLQFTLIWQYFMNLQNTGTTLFGYLMKR